MNRVILRYGAPITVVVLAVFAWVVVRRILDGGAAAVLVLAITAVVVWPIGTVALIVAWPRITVRGYRRAILRGGLGGGPVAVNTLVVSADRPSGSGAAGGLLSTGSDELLYIGGWVDVRSAPRLLDVPAMGGRYFSLQFTDPTDGAACAYVGTRTTGPGPGTFLLCARGWAGAAPAGATRIDVPHGTALVIGRVLARDDEDRRSAAALARRIRLAEAT